MSAFGRMRTIQKNRLMAIRSEELLYLNASGLSCCDFIGSAFYYISSFPKKIIQAAYLPESSKLLLKESQRFTIR